MENETLRTPASGQPEISYSGYVAGFIMSVILTLVAYFLVSYHMLTTPAVLYAIAALGLVQLFIQLRLFLHLGKETSPKWRLVAFGFMVLIVLILVGGSLWIMTNLNYRSPSPTDVNKYLQNQDGI